MSSPFVADRRGEKSGVREEVCLPGKRTSATLSKRTRARRTHTFGQGRALPSGRCARRLVRPTMQRNGSHRGHGAAADGVRRHRTQPRRAGLTRRSCRVVPSGGPARTCAGVESMARGNRTRRRAETSVHPPVLRASAVGKGAGSSEASAASHVSCGARIEGGVMSQSAIVDIAGPSAGIAHAGEWSARPSRRPRRGEIRAS